MHLRNNRDFSASVTAARLCASEAINTRTSTPAPPPLNSKHSLACSPVQRHVSVENSNQEWLQVQ